MKSKLMISIIKISSLILLIFLFSNCDSPTSIGVIVEWAKLLGGEESDVGRSVFQTNDGGYIVSGNRWITEVNSDILIIKIDAQGNEEWINTFGGADNSHSHSIIQTTDGSYIITGELDFNVYLLKIDVNGNELWSKTFGGTKSDVGHSVKQTADGGYIVTGYTKSFGSGAKDVYLIKTDENGNEEWIKTFGDNYNDCGYSLDQTSDGGYIIAGYSNSYGTGSWDVYLIKTDSAGNEEWFKTFGGNSGEEGNCVKHTSDGGYIIVGYTKSFGAGESDIYLIKTDTEGNEEWTKAIGRDGFDVGFSVEQTIDNGFIIVGYTCVKYTEDCDVYLIKTDENGNEEWIDRYTTGGFEEGRSIMQTNDGGYIIAGSACSFERDDCDVFLIKTH